MSYSLSKIQKMNYEKEIKRNYKEIAHLKKQLTEMKKRFQLIASKFQEYELANEFEDFEKDDEPVDDEIDFQESVRNNIIKDISENLAVPSNCRRYSTVTYKFSYILFNFSPKAYRYLRNVIPLPSKVSLLRASFPKML